MVAVNMKRYPPYHTTPHQNTSSMQGTPQHYIAANSERKVGASHRLFYGLLLTRVLFTLIIETLGLQAIWFWCVWRLTLDAWRRSNIKWALPPLSAYEWIVCLNGCESPKQKRLLADGLWIYNSIYITSKCFVYKEWRARTLLLK